MDTPQQRLQAFINQHFTSRIEFCNKIGMRNDTLTKYIGKGTSVIGKKYHERLSNVGLNLSWYFTGEGEMLSGKNKVIYPEKNPSHKPEPLKTGSIIL